ncbi:ligand-gated cation channel ZACN [Ambystoma mexicanum]|uniref:ligand-gated cation channel ZACN n=1 Tax=Ambystoma mexicanum TaxID=8296 RepID=UPI0037E7CA5C
MLKAAGMLGAEMSTTRVLLALLLTSAGLRRSSQEEIAEQQDSSLITSLLETYSAVQMPNNGSMPLRVSILISVSNVMDVDILQYTISSVLMLNQSWYDYRLRWNETQYPHHSITVPLETVWTPSFSIREAHTVETKDLSPKVKLHSSGWVQHILGLRVDSNCNFELFRYPEDDTDCQLTFSSLLDTELAFEVSYVNEIENVKHEYLVTTLDARTSHGPGPPSFSLTLHLQHTPSKTVLSLIVPSFAVLIADVFGFMLPILGNERISYKVTLLLGYLVFHSSLVNGLPGSSSCNPLLIHLFLSILTLLFISMIETIFVTRIASEDLPSWMSRILWTHYTPGNQNTGDDGKRIEAEEDRVTEPRSAQEMEQRRQKLAAGLDRGFTIVYVSFLLLFYAGFAGTWFLMECHTEARPRPRPGF